jgi:hypothetical protein
MGQSASTQISNKINIMYLKYTPNTDNIITSVDNIIQFLNSGYIYTELDDILAKQNVEGKFIDFSKIKLEDEYPGVYMNLVSSNMVGSPIGDDISLYFCKSLLNRKDWHFNKLDSDGFLNPENTILSLQNLKKFINEGGDLIGNEIVFHHSVPVNFVSKINCKNINVAGLFYTRLPDHLKKIFQPLIQDSKTIFFQDLECSDKVVEMSPNYCFVFQKDLYSGYNAPIEYYRWMAVKCGLTKDQVASVYDPAELNKMLKPLMYSRFKQIAEDWFWSSVVIDKDGEKRDIKEFYKGKRFIRKVTNNKLEIKISKIIMANSHPNIVKIYNIYPNKEDGSYTNIDMEFLEVNVGLDFNVYESLLENAKEFMHNLGIAYVDWAKENIGFSAEGTAKVFNFDVSALYDPKTNIFTEIPEPKGYLWRNAEEADMNTPIEVDNWIFNRMFTEKGAPGSDEWAEAMGHYHSISRRSPFTSSEDCMTKTYLDRKDMKALYTKDQLYHMANAMGLNVNKSMRKDEICALISS